MEEVEHKRAAAQRELDALRGRRERIEQMERDRDALLDIQEDAAPGALDNLEPEERHQFYKIGRLEVVGHVDGRIEVTGPLAMTPEACNSDGVL